MKKGLAIIALGALLYGSNLIDANMYIKTKEFDKAMKILKPEAKKGNKQAQLLLGKLYFERKETATDFTLAHKWLIESKKRANYELGTLYLYGLGVERDTAKGLRLLSLSKNPAVDLEMAKLYLEGDILPKDPEKGFRLLRKSAEEDKNPEACYQLGMLYIKGNIPDIQGKDKAAVYIKRAADKGHKDALEAWNRYELWKFK